MPSKNEPDTPPGLEAEVGVKMVQKMLEDQGAAEAAERTKPKPKPKPKGRPKATTKPKGRPKATTTKAKNAPAEPPPPDDDELPPELFEMLAQLVAGAPYKLFSTWLELRGLPDSTADKIRALWKMEPQEELMAVGALKVLLARYAPSLKYSLPWIVLGTTFALGGGARFTLTKRLIAEGRRLDDEQKFPGTADDEK